MEKPSRVREVAALIVAALAGSLLGPRLAGAVGGTIVSIQDGRTGNTTNARVTKASQLYSVETEPVNYLELQFPGISQPGVCFSLSPAPAKGFIGRQISVDPFSNPSPSSGDFVEIYLGSACAQTLVSSTPTTSDPITIPFDPGFAVPAGGGISLKVFGDLHISMFVYGYTVPASAVPAGPTVVRTTSRVDRPALTGR